MVSCWRVLCWVELMDDFSLSSQLWDVSQHFRFPLCWDLMLFNVKEDQVSPTCTTSAIEYVSKLDYEKLLMTWKLQACISNKYLRTYLGLML